MQNIQVLIEVAQSWCDSNGYVFIGDVGGGAFKRVFHVQNSEGKSVALKIVMEPSASPRTEREISAIERCNNPYIAKLFGVGKYLFEENDYDYILEEYLAGGSLSNRFDQNGHFTDTEIEEIGAYLIESLAHLKELDLVHRDIKPDNIMFRDDGKTPVLVAFGLVRDLQDSSLTQSWINRGPGTPFYSAPEQLNNEKHLIDWRTDQFSLGVTLAYLRYGLHPYQHVDDSNGYDAVERVASRGSHSKQFLDLINSEETHCLVKMTMAWSVERFRNVEELSATWKKQWT